jgi:hypothetical protein
MADLSPAAQKVLDAASPVYDDETLYVAIGEQHAGKIAAAALRAAADQVVPPSLEAEFCNRNPSLTLQKAVEIRAAFLSIATELENH